MAVRIEHYYNVDRQRFSDAEGTPLALEQLPRIALTQQAVLALTCIRDDGTPAAFNSDDSFSWAADDDWSSVSDVALLSPDSEVNRAGDWSEANPAAGKLGIRVDADSAALQAVLGSEAEVLLHGELKVYAAGATKPYFVGRMELYARNLVDFAGVTPPAIPANFYSRSEVDGLLAGLVESGDLADYLKATAPTTLTVANGEVTATQLAHAIDTEGNAATDDLVSILGGSAGRWLVLFPADAGRLTTLRHGIGNIVTGDGNDVAMSGSGLYLLVHDGANWRVSAGRGSSLAALVAVAATPSNYTPASADVEAHLAAIDDALAGGGGGGMTLVATATLASAANAVDFTGLTIDEGQVYELHLFGSLDGAAPGNVYCDDGNGTLDATSSNYSIAEWWPSGSFANASNNQLWGTSLTGGIDVVMRMRIHVDPRTHQATMLSYSHALDTGAPGRCWQVAMNRRNSTQSNNRVTALRVYTGNAGVNFVAGSVANLYKVG